MNTMKNFFGLSLICVVLCACTVLAEPKPVNIAVLDLQAQGHSASDVQVIASQLRYELFQSGLFTVVERSEMDQVLKEQGFQQSGCTSDQCVVEIGQLLGVQQMVAGSLGAAGSYYLLNIRFIDMATGRIVANESIKTKNSMDAMLDRGLKDLMIAVKKKYSTQVSKDSAATTGKKKSPARIIIPVAGALAAGGAAAAVLVLGKSDKGSDNGAASEASLNTIDRPGHPAVP